VTDEPEGQIDCATYTHARRHPMVMGQIAGWTPPFQLTLNQVGVLLVTYLIEIQTWRWWGRWLPGALGIAVALAVPCLLAWVVRRTRFEGRSLPRAVLGWARLLWTPHGGEVGGRPYRPARPAAPLNTAIYVASGREGW
jgi:hypothetical protein